MEIIKIILIVIAAIILAIPLVFLTALVSVPILRIIEQSWGLEVIGHSGPAEWVLWTIWVVISLAIAATILLFRTKKRRA